MEREASRYSLATLFEYMTICGIFSAAATLIGPFSSGCLMLLALAMFARRGAAAVIALGATFFACDISLRTDEFGANVDRQAVVYLLAGGLCVRCLALRKRDVE